MVARREPTEFIEKFGDLRRRISSVAAQAYATVEMGGTQAKFLRYIRRHGRMSQAELARATDTDPTLTGRIVQSLIERRLVRRERSDEDRREYVLELTPSGRRTESRVEKLRSELATRVVAALDARDLDDFDRVVNKILAALEAPVERG